MPPHLTMFAIVSSLVTLGALGVVYTWAIEAFGWQAPQRKRVLAIALLLLLVLDRVFNAILVTHHTGQVGLALASVAVAHAALVLVFGTIILAAIPVVLLLVVSRAASRSIGAPRPEIAGPEATMSRRRLVEGVGGAALFGATGSMLGWGMVRGRHEFELREVPIRVPGLPRVLDGYTIAQISDLHAGLFVGDRELRAGLSLVAQAHPDLIVVTGDLVDFDPIYAPMVASHLASLTARDGVTAILGNHDYYAGSGAVLEAIRKANIQVLLNEGRRMRAGDGGGFALLGVDDLSAVRHGGRGPDLSQALSDVPNDLARILLSHQPLTIEQWAGQVGVQLSGHTHGGQINPGFSPLGLITKYVAGSYEVGGTTLYVNRGFGTVGAPSRVGVPPEISRIVLVAT